MSSQQQAIRRVDDELRKRAARVIPGGMYGHQAVQNMHLPANFPQFMVEGDGPYVVDADGNRYIDLMCSYGPIILGHRHPKVEEAVRGQLARGDCLDVPSPRIVELAERLVATIDYSGWAIFAKNGTDATTGCLTVARAATGRSIILAVRGSYHGAAPWCTPWPAGVLPSDRVAMRYFDYNDLASLQEAADEAGDDLAGVIITPFKHIEGQDQELVDPKFAQALRKLCDDKHALLILDEVRCGLRFNLGSSWDSIGVRPDLSAWSKALANGYAIAAIVGTEELRSTAERVFFTGSFWFSAVSMAAALATIAALRDEWGVQRMAKAGQKLRDGIQEQAAAHGLDIHYTGHVTMPYMTFPADQDYERLTLFAASALEAGTYLSPRHNWFLSAAHDDDVIDKVLESTDRAFDVVQRAYGRDES
jgi:glutamate-1-semialdehyde 2,1-aminomutase